MLSPVHDLTVGVWRGGKTERAGGGTSKAASVVSSALFAYEVYSTHNVRTLWSFRAKWWKTW